MSYEQTARERMALFGCWLSANKGQQLWSLVDNGRDFSRRVDCFQTRRGLVLIVVTSVGPATTWSVFGEAGAGLPHADRLAALDVVLSTIPTAAIKPPRLCLACGEPFSSVDLAATTCLRCSVAELGRADAEEAGTVVSANDPAFLRRVMELKSEVVRREIESQPFPPPTEPTVIEFEAATTGSKLRQPSLF